MKEEDEAEAIYDLFYNLIEIKKEYEKIDEIFNNSDVDKTSAINIGCMLIATHYCKDLFKNRQDFIDRCYTSLTERESKEYAYDILFGY